jgi:hypothetical protein
MQMEWGKKCLHVLNKEKLRKAVFCKFDTRMDGLILKSIIRKYDIRLEGTQNLLLFVSSDRFLYS